MKIVKKMVDTFFTGVIFGSGFILALWTIEQISEFMR